MKSSRSQLVGGLALLALLGVDIGLTAGSSHWGDGPAWGKLAGALVIQVAVVCLVMWRFRSGLGSGQPARQLLTLVGVCVVAVGFSMTLIYVSVNCPNESLPTVKGKPLCSRS